MCLICRMTSCIPMIMSMCWVLCSLDGGLCVENPSVLLGVFADAHRIHSLVCVGSHGLKRCRRGERNDKQWNLKETSAPRADFDMCNGANASRDWMGY